MPKISRGIVKPVFYILLAVGLQWLIPSMFYSVIDSMVADHIRATVDGTWEEMNKAYQLWYLQYEWVLFITEFLIKIAIIVMLLKYVLKISFSDVGVTSFKRGYKQLCLGFTFGVILITVTFISLVMTGNAEVVSWTPDFSVEILKYLLVFVLVGFSEEFLYRGYIITNLRKFSSISVTMFISSIIFSLVHSQNESFHFMSFLNIVLVGLLFAYMFIKTGSLWMPIGFHISWNYFQGIVYGFNVSGLGMPGIFTTDYPSNNLLNGGGFGPEGGLIVTAVTLLGILYIWWHYREVE